MDILQYVLDGFDGHAQFYVAVAIHGSQQQLVVWNNPSVVNLLTGPRASYSHANVTYLSTIVRAAPPVQWVRSYRHLIGFWQYIALDTFCYINRPACKGNWD